MLPTTMEKLSNFLVNKKGGLVLWKPAKASLFDEHILRDESVEHCVPAPHHDFFYSSIKFYVPPNKLKDVLSISGSVNYDGLKKMLTARCGGIGANIATLYLAMNVASGNMSIKTVKKGNYYARHIREEAKKYPEMKKEMSKMKRENHKLYKKELSDPYYALAFKGC